MTQQTSPFLEGKYGWDFGESGWNSGMDENLLKFSFMFDRNVDSVTASLPSAVNGQAHYLTTDNRIYFAVGTTYYSSPIPKWFQVVLRSTGDVYQYDGVSLALIDSPSQIDSRLDAVELTLSSLGSAAFEDSSFFATQAALDVVEADAQSYTDAQISAIPFEPVFNVHDYGAVGDGVADDTAAIQAAIDAAASANGTVVDEPGKIYVISVITIKNGVRSFNMTKGTIRPDSSTAGVTTGAVRLNGNTRFAGGVGSEVRNCIISVRMDMQNGGRVAVATDNVSDNTFRDCRIFGFTNDATLNHYGLLFWHGSSRNRVYNNSIVGVTNPTQRGLLIDFIGDAAAFASYFSASGVTTRATTPCLNNVICGNVLQDGSYGVNLLGCENTVVANNICKGQNHRSIYLAEACAFNIIANNECSDFLSTAVLLGYGCIENQVIGNICKREPGVQAAGTGEAVINITTGAQRNYIANNKCYADTNYGIYMACNMSHNIVQNNEVRGYYLAGIALESDWEAIADKPAGALYSRPNFQTPGSVSPGATQWSFSSAENNRIIGNTIREGASGRSVAAIYVAQVDSNTNLNMLRNEISNNTVYGNSDMAHYIYIFEETSGRLVNNKLHNNTWTDTPGIPSASKIFLSRGRLHFNYQKNNDVIDDVVTIFTDGDTTPSVGYGGSFQFNNTTPTTVTTFDDGVVGQEILVRMSANTTIVHNSGVLRTANSADVSGRTANDWMRFRFVSGNVWIETGRSFSLALTGQATYDPPSLVDGAGVTTTVTVTGAALGDIATASFSNDLQGILMTAYVSATNTVSVRLQNETTGTIDLASGTLRARVMRQ